MRKILREFHFENIIPSERQTAPSSELRRAVSNVARCEQQLNEQLNETEKAILTELVQHQYEVDSITACENFILGFRLGTVINIKGESYRLKERKEFMRQKQRIVNTLFEQGST